MDFILGLKSPISCLFQRQSNCDLTGFPRTTTCGWGLVVGTHGTCGPNNLIMKLRQDLVLMGLPSILGFHTLTPIRDTVCSSFCDGDTGPSHQCQPGFPRPYQVRHREPSYSTLRSAPSLSPPCSVQTGWCLLPPEGEIQNLSCFPKFGIRFICSETLWPSTLFRYFLASPHFYFLKLLTTPTINQEDIFNLTSRTTKLGFPLLALDRGPGWASEQVGPEHPSSLLNIELQDWSFWWPEAMSALTLVLPDSSA